MRLRAKQFLKRAALAALFGVVGVMPAFAALPPYYQRVREIEAILGDDRIQKSLGGALIDSITYIDIDRYQIVGGSCLIEVRIVDVPPPEGQGMMVGPRQFALEPGEADCGDGN